MRDTRLLLGAAVVAAHLLAGCATTAGPAASASAAAPATYGVEFLDTRLSAGDHMVDLRYRVLDADKAAPLLDRKLKPVLVNARNGHRYYVPQPPIIGALRQTSRNHAVKVGRTYFMLFANPDRELQAGDRLALWVGDKEVGEFTLH